MGLDQERQEIPTAGIHGQIESTFAQGTDIAGGTAMVKGEFKHFRIIGLDRLNRQGAATQGQGRHDQPPGDHFAGQIIILCLHCSLEPSFGLLLRNRGSCGKQFGPQGPVSPFPGQIQTGRPIRGGAVHVRLLGNQEIEERIIMVLAGFEKAGHPVIERQIDVGSQSDQLGGAVIIARLQNDGEGRFALGSFGVHCFDDIGKRKKVIHHLTLVLSQSCMQRGLPKARGFTEIDSGGMELLQNEHFAVMHCRDGTFKSRGDIASFQNEKRLPFRRRSQPIIQARQAGKNGHDADGKKTVGNPTFPS